MNSKGQYSYALTSAVPKRGSDLVMKKIFKEITENISIKQLLSSSSVFRVADLGCSIGPNTFFAVNDIIQAIVSKHIAEGQKDNTEDLEFQVFFNDQTVNDFNVLFRSLPPQRRYFASGVPGSFYDRLFPKASLQFVYSAYSIHWMSTVPEEVLDRTSPAWNKERILYGTTEVKAAFLAQHKTDMARFLTARAQEIIPGGILALLVLGRQDNVNPLKCGVNAIISLLGYALMDMANLGMVEKAKVDDFNLPMYFPSSEELKEAIDSNGNFAIRRIEASVIPIPTSVVEIQIAINLFRSVTEELLTKCFGYEVMDELFDRFAKKIFESGIYQDPSYVSGAELFVFLTRISDD